VSRPNDARSYRLDGDGEGEARLFIDTSRAESRAEPVAEAEPELGAPELRPQARHVQILMSESGSVTLDSTPRRRR
jgi:hypothetical protein